MEKFVIHTDGGSRGNPGIAGAGCVISDSRGKVLKEASKFLGEMTNNEAEYQGVILGLKELKKIIGKEKTKKVEVEVVMDSELVVRQLSGIYQIKEEKLFLPFITIWNMRVSEFPNLTFKSVPREKNKDADRLANVAMDSSEQKKLF